MPRTAYPSSVVSAFILARVIDEPSSTKVWRQGAQREVRSAERLSKHLAGTGVLLLHDRRVPGHGQANIDHLATDPVS